MHKVIGILFGLLITLASADVDPKRVHVIDYRSKTTNGGAALVFRGNTPVSDDGTSLNFTTWFSVMATNAYAQVGVQFAPPSQVYVIDISLEDPYLDYQFPEEVTFWKDPANAAKGKFINWQLYGSMNYPPDFNASQQDSMARNVSLWAIDHLPERVLAIRQLMLQGPPAGYSQLAIYFHCTHGQDRTGEFSNAYRLAWHSSIQDGNRLSNALAMRGSKEGSAGSANSRQAIVGGGGILGNPRVHKNKRQISNIEVPPNLRNKDELTTMGAIYALGCQEGLRCPMYTFTANAGWYCLWSNVINGTSYTDCSTAYSCVPLLFCDPTNV